MDFSTLARRQLQALCKKNKIPANITNVAMIDALNALETVEGIEELLKPGESEMENSSIESPEKNVNTQQSVPPTSYRTSTRQKPAIDEDESQQSLTRTSRGGTSRRIAGDVEEAVTRTPAVRSSRKKAPAVQLKENEENKTVPQTPAAAPSTLRRGTRASTRKNMNSDLMEGKEEKTTAVRRVYGTRRSVRLSEKKVVESDISEKETTQPIKMDALSEDMGEVSENTVVPGSEQALVGQNSNVSSEAVKDQNDESFSRLEVSADAVSSDCASSNVVVSGVDSQMQEEAKSSLAEEPVLTDLVIEKAEKSESDGSNSSNNPKLEDTIQDPVNEEQQSGLSVTAVTNPVPEVQEQSNDSNADDAENYPLTDYVQDLELSFAADGKEESKENDDELEVDSIESIGEITSNNELGSDKSLPAVDFSFQNEDVRIVGPNDDSVEKPKIEPTHEVAVKPAVDSVGLTNDESDFSTDSELDFKEPIHEESEEEAEADCVGPIKDELSAKSVKGSVKLSSPIKGNVSTLILADDDALPILSPLMKSLSPSPLKKSSSKSPLTARRIAARVLDDKENIDHSGRKLELRREKKGKVETKRGKALIEVTSLRKLKKMVREEMQKLQISDKDINSVNNEEESIEEVAKMRMALQALPENQVEMEN